MVVCVTEERDTELYALSPDVLTSPIPSMLTLKVPYLTHCHTKLIIIMVSSSVLYLAIRCLIQIDYQSNSTISTNSLWFVKSTVKPKKMKSAKFLWSYNFSKLQCWMYSIWDLSLSGGLQSCQQTVSIYIQWPVYSDQ